MRRYDLSYTELLETVAGFAADGAQLTVQLITTDAAVDALSDEVRREFRQKHTSAVIYAETESGKYTIIPPFRLRGAHASLDAEQLYADLANPYTVGLLLLRLGRYALGVATGGELRISKTGSVYVKGKHKKGGQSSMRFTRSRNMWIQKLFDTTAAEFNKLRTAHGAPLDYIYLFGDKIVIKQFLNRAGLAAEYTDKQLVMGKAQAKHANLQTLRETVKTLSSAAVLHERKA